ncbi:hypothetical protein [Nocardioides sp. W7]|uniref:DUF7544 domain-containing protein n=1 Tax=Nocardioides sp. W7 TaxID=2931390 RepID=UPI001FD370C7|nr:hypothetical protein [Nocardioides sp. W7]
MSGYEGYPPPGSPPPSPSPPPPGWQQPPPGWQQPPAYQPFPGPAPGMLGAAHKPGAIPLRPLGLGDLYDGAFRIIRYNPKATAGVAVLVTAASTVLTLLTVAGLLALGAEFTQTADFSESDSLSVSDVFGGGAALFSTLVLPTLLQFLGTLLVSGMVVHVVMAAAVGRRLAIGEAWRATHGKRWRLIGLTLLLGLLTMLLVAAYVVLFAVVIVVIDDLLVGVVFGLVTVPLFVAGLCWFWVRVYYLPVPVLMLEDVGVLGAIRRGYGLTRRAFWRTFGIALLTLLLQLVAASLLSVPFAIAGEVLVSFVDGSAGVLGLEAMTGLGTIVASAFVTPFVAAVTALQYIDLRMRKEAFDVELLTRAGIIES